MLGSDATAVLLLLALAADKHGASFYGRHRMASALGVSMNQIDAALQRLRDHRLVDFVPWKKRGRDGVWQLLPIPQVCRYKPRSGRVLDIRSILDSLGLTPPKAGATFERQDPAPTASAE